MACRVVTLHLFDYLPMQRMSAVGSVEPRISIGEQVKTGHSGVELNRSPRRWQLVASSDSGSTVFTFRHK